VIFAAGEGSENRLVGVAKARKARRLAGERRLGAGENDGPFFVFAEAAVNDQLTR
jgi:hypothetical protein